MSLDWVFARKWILNSPIIVIGLSNNHQSRLCGWHHIQELLPFGIPSTIFKALVNLKPRAHRWAYPIIIKTNYLYFCLGVPQHSKRLAEVAEKQAEQMLAAELLTREVKRTFEVYTGMMSEINTRFSVWNERLTRVEDMISAARSGKGDA